MKTIISIATLILFILNTGCDKKADQQVEELAHKDEAEGQAGMVDIPEVDDDLLSEIYELQERIKLDHQDIELRKAYCQKAYFPESNYIISMGIGRLYNPKLEKPIPQVSAERAALMDAVRWVGYVEVWLDQQYQPDFGKLNKRVNRPLKVINQVTIGDSLFVFYATKTDKH